MKQMISVFSFLLALLFLLPACTGRSEPEDSAPVTTVTSSAGEDRTVAEDTSPGISIRVLSQNLRSGDDPDGNSIRERQPRFAELVNTYEPDLIGTQETTFGWNVYLKRVFGEEYAFVGCSREGRDATDGEWNTILYRKDRFALVDSDTFWLTATPQTVSAVSGAKCKRICTWALLRELESGVTVLFCNTHLDHSNDTVRGTQAEYLIAGLQEFVGKYPIFLTGDFNAQNTSAPYQTIKKVFADAHQKAKKRNTKVSYTFHGYGKSQKEIDFVFFDPAFAVPQEYCVVSDDFGGFVSDHYGILTDFGVLTGTD